MKLTLFGYRVLLLCDDMLEKHGGLILPKAHSERTRVATVVVVGDKVTQYKPGDKVVLSWYTGIHLHLIGQEINGVKVDEDNHRIVNEDEILGLAEFE